MSRGDGEDARRGVMAGAPIQSRNRRFGPPTSEGTPRERVYRADGRLPGQSYAGRPDAKDLRPNGHSIPWGLLS